VAGVAFFLEVIQLSAKLDSEPGGPMSKRQERIKLSFYQTYVSLPGIKQHCSEVLRNPSNHFLGRTKTILRKAGFSVRIVPEPGNRCFTIRAIR
jgi:hypothetical protein